MSRLLVLFNPAAGDGKAGAAIEEAVAELRQAGHRVEVRPTDSAAEARRLVSLLAADFDRVAACGGDGTISAVAAGLFESGIPRPLVVVPAGTANDFAAAVGAGNQPAEALRLAFEGSVAPLDVGLAGSTPFVNAVSAGAAAEISEAASPDLKATLGPLAYLASGLSHLASLRSFDCRLGGEAGIYEGLVFFFAVANGQTVGGGTRVAPAALVDDGLLDLVILPSMPPSSLVGALRALRSGGDHTALVRLQGRRFEFEADREVALSCDGEARRARSLTFSVAAGALSLVVHGPAPARRGGMLKKGVDTQRPF